MGRLPPLNALKAFEAAARHLSFSRAAEELHVTPAAVSHQVKALEDHLGVALFRRLARGLALTEAGRGYLPQLTEGFALLERATAGVLALKGSETLVVSVLSSFGAGWLMPRLGSFRRRHPHIDVEVHGELRCVDFAADGVDVAVRYAGSPPSGLFTRLLLTEEVFPVCSPRLQEGPHPLRRAEDLRHHTLLHDVNDSDGWLDWGALLARIGLADLETRRGPRFSDTTMALQAAMAGEGVALGRTGVMGDTLISGRLVRPLDVSWAGEKAYYLVAPKANLARPKVAAFIDWALDEAGKSAFLDSGAGAR